MAEIAVSSVTEGELRLRVARKPEAARLRAVVDEFLLRVTILPWDSDAARQYGAASGCARTGGQPMGSLDPMILETAVSHSFYTQPSRRQAIGKALAVTRRVNCAAVGNPTVSGVGGQDRVQPPFLG